MELLKYKQRTIKSDRADLTEDYQEIYETGLDLEGLSAQDNFEIELECLKLPEINCNKQHSMISLISRKGLKKSYLFAKYSNNLKLYFQCVPLVKLTNKVLKGRT